MAPVIWRSFMPWILGILALSLHAVEYPKEGPLPPGALGRFRAEKHSELKGSARVSYSPDGRILAVSGIKQQLWDLETGKLIFEFSGGGPVTFTPDNRLVSSAVFSHAHHIQVFDLVKKEELPHLDEHSAEVTSLAFSPPYHLPHAAAVYPATREIVERKIENSIESRSTILAQPRTSGFGKAGLDFPFTMIFFKPGSGGTCNKTRFGA